MFSNISGVFNSASGYEALKNNTTGWSNTALGYTALNKNINGDDNVAIGVGALYSNEYGDQNIALGVQALEKDTLGSNIIAIGFRCMQNSMNKTKTIAIGDSALFNNGTGATLSYHGAFNTTVGSKSMFANTTGYYNTALGYEACKSNNTGSGNTSIGYQSLITNTTGSNNTALGNGADVTSGNLSYATAVGYDSKVASSNSLILGGTGTAYTYVGIGLTNPTDLLHLQARTGYDASVKIVAPSSYSSSVKLFENGDYGYEFEYDGNDDKLYLWSRNFSGNEGKRMTWLKNGNVGIGTTSPSYLFEVGTSGDGTEARANAWNTFSDKRWKTNIKLIDNPIEKLKNINGYYYNWKNGKDKSLQVGVIAQEVEEVLPEIVSTDNNGYKSVDYSKLAPLLVEAVKQQQQTISQQNKTIQELINRIEILENNK